jgi:carboxyl-terminal processing protease
MMKRMLRKAFGRRPSGAILAAAAVLAIALPSARVADEFFEISKNMEIFNSVYRELNIYYVDDTKPGELMKTGIDAMLRSLDPYTVYYPESKIEDAMFMQTGQYGGIGTLINTVKDKITITDPYQGYPAAKTGLRAGDVIIRVNGKSVEGKKQDEVSELLTGAPGTEVEVTVTRFGESAPLTFRIKREEIKVPDVPYYAMLDDGKTGYIKLTGFTQTASADVRSAFLSLKKQEMKQCVLDLRGNGGGLLREAINIVNLFVPKGTEIVQTRGKIPEWNKRYTALNEPLDLTMPVIVLIDEYSASASEIVSGSLQDLDRAVVIGDESYGKGLVQQTKDVAYNSKMKLTVAKYYTPSGRCIQRLDYSHRDDESGEAKAVADSLIKPFRTRNGRTVYDGRGISPDVEIEAEAMGQVVAGLIDEWLIFDWATRYRATHPSVDSVSFSLSDAEFREFIRFAEEQGFEYETETMRLYEEMKKIADEEKYYEDASKEFDHLLARVKPDTARDMEKFSDQIRTLLENEIAARYYYQDGRTRQSLPEDPYLRKSLEVFASDYSSLLSGTAPAKK